MQGIPHHRGIGACSERDWLVASRRRKAAREAVHGGAKMGPRRTKPINAMRDFAKRTHFRPNALVSHE